MTEMIVEHKGYMVIQDNGMVTIYKDGKPVKVMRTARGLSEAQMKHMVELLEKDGNDKKQARG